jgi:hypothetical protein
MVDFSGWLEVETVVVVLCSHHIGGKRTSGKIIITQAKPQSKK